MHALIKIMWAFVFQPDEQLQGCREQRAWDPFHLFVPSGPTKALVEHSG